MARERIGIELNVATTTGDINTFANGLLLDFVDAFHAALRNDLEKEFGDEWLEQGVLKYLHPQYCDRTKQMLESPMRVVDMGKTDDELYGVEHLANILEGNWKTIYAERLGDRDRVKVYLGEVAEVRHNLSHRRRRHILRSAEVMRLAQNCEKLLRAIDAPEAETMAGIVKSLSAGRTPWGASLGGYLPAQDEVVEEFVGRPEQLRELTSWIAQDAPQLLVWGYGGAGKSALAYEFAREMRAAAPGGVNAACWVSAKRAEFVAGAARPKHADFIDRKSLVTAIFNAIYEVNLSEDDISEEGLLEHLRDLPILLVVDDFDTVLEDDALVEFLMHEVRATGSRVLYTSRQKVAGIRSIEVLGFDGDELDGFIRLRAAEHELDPEVCVSRAAGIRSVTGGFPLFVDDLLRYARIDGIKAAVEDWSQRRGDAAREYALRRQLEQLGDSARETLIALAVADRPLTALEFATLAGTSDEDAEHAVQSLLSWRLISRHSGDGEERPLFTLNQNTRRLAVRTYGNDPRVDVYRTRFRVLKSPHVPAARRTAVAAAVGSTRSLVMRGDVATAISRLKERMTGELEDSAELYGALGWAYSRVPDEHADDARRAFQRAYELGNAKEDTYVHWSSLEIGSANAAIHHVPDRELLSRWQAAARAAEVGLKVCGASKGLCQAAGYARSREAKTLERLNEFTLAQGAFAESAAHFRRGLAAPEPGVRHTTRDTLYQGLVIALEGLGLNDELTTVQAEWQAARDLEGGPADDH